ncbi:ATP-binding cassette domain-containing protein [Rhodoferax sp. GW822-FHT02A01]|uniref:ABC transporter ATP-binding protein n=1 Tax=Rhodoferax sp. GW822-FHT02A01 TaxID=3141537 RepID=UPI00315D6A34
MSKPITDSLPPEKISLSNIHKRYGAAEVLKGVSLQANQGDVVAILGASGSGKSTLLRCANFLEMPDEGEVRIDGEQVQLQRSKDGRRTVSDAAQLQRIRTRAAMVFQSFNLWSHRTVLENLIEAPVHVQKRPRAECIAEAEVLLEKVGLAAKRHAYPARLSGGQQQRVAIARALAMHPEVLLFDEPTSALDPELVAEVLGVMRALAEEGRTMLVVTHEMGFARHVSTRTVFLHQGAVEEQGPSEQVFSQPRSERLRQFIQRIGG